MRSSTGNMLRTEIFSGSPALMPATKGPATTSAISCPARRRANDATDSSSSLARAGTNGSRNSRNFASVESRRDQISAGGDEGTAINPRRVSTYRRLAPGADATTSPRNPRSSMRSLSTGDDTKLCGPPSIKSPPTRCVVMQPPGRSVPSNTATRMANARQANAHASPDMPAPTIATSTAPPSITSSRSADGNTLVAHARTLQRGGDLIGQTTDERWMALHRARALEFRYVRGLRDRAILDIDLVQRFDMFADECDRHDAHRTRAGASKFADQRIRGGLQPLLRPEPALKRQMNRSGVLQRRDGSRPRPVDGIEIPG